MPASSHRYPRQAISSEGRSESQMSSVYVLGTALVGVVFARYRGRMMYQTRREWGKLEVENSTPEEWEREELGLGGN
jgi:hypothetical protein